MKYLTVKARSSESLDISIEEHVNNRGWKLYGSPFFYTDRVNHGGFGMPSIQREFFCQVIIKEDE